MDISGTGTTVIQTSRMGAIPINLVRLHRIRVAEIGLFVPPMIVSLLRPKDRLVFGWGDELVSFFSSVWCIRTFRLCVCDEFIQISDVELIMLSH